VSRLPADGLTVVGLFVCFELLTHCKRGRAAVVRTGKRFGACWHVGHSVVVPELVGFVEVSRTVWTLSISN
jgi:hypothetical protein